MNLPNTDDLLSLQLFQIIKKVVEKSKVETYLIGGFVRDFLLNKKESKDIDIVAIGSGIEIAKSVQRELPNAGKIHIFKNYGTAMFKWEGVVLEFVGARKESYSIESRNPIVEKGTLENDQNRRDFTINTIAISLNSSNFGKILDPFNGFDDIKNGIIKTPLDPDKTYSDDPLIMLRAVIFESQLNFKIEKRSLNSIYENKDRIEIISKERVVDEINKIISSKKPSVGFRILEQTGLLKNILPEIQNLKGIEEIEGFKHKDNFYHTLEVLDNICESNEICSKTCFNEFSSNYYCTRNGYRCCR